MTLLNKALLALVGLFAALAFVEHKVVKAADVTIASYKAQIKQLELSSQERLKDYESAHQRSAEESKEDAQMVKDIQNQIVPKDCQLAIEWAIDQTGRI